MSPAIDWYLGAMDRLMGLLIVNTNILTDAKPWNGPFNKWI